MKLLIVLVFSLFSLTVMAQESCGEIPRLEKRLENLKEKCGQVVKCDSLGGMGLTPEETVDVCMSKTYSRSMCVQYLTCENLEVTKCRSFGGYALSKEGAIKECVSKGFTRSMCIEHLDCE